ncbi:MAG: cyclopropane-fatty-acyl-phospholipid synthase family protein [Pseudomonadota bacterium]|nr:cyclopropane-fatty-acyl-phospholipid synthase family protein [Pseudomonadota bacterium]
MNIEAYLNGMFREGALEVRLPGSRNLVVGDGSPPELAVAIADRLTVARIIARPSLGVGEAYMNGKLVMERGSIHDLVELASRNTAHRPNGPPAGRLKRGWTKLMRERNERRGARRNVAHHYDLSLELYRSFLDEDLQYSCAYFEQPDTDLNEAQGAKKRHIAAKLHLEDDQRVLDIGCGWGGLALSLAGWKPVKVDGVTLSTEQLGQARNRAEAAGLASRVSFSLTDYRDIVGPYERIVSVGMFEHVGRPNYQAFFDQVARLLTGDGVALIHSIGRSEGPSTTDPFTAKYIFPGGYIPALSEVLPAVERAGLRVADIEILRLHYAYTLDLWRRRFLANWNRVAALYDERFCRMWEYYLCGAEMGFRYGGHMNFQLQLTKRVDALPITRRYMDETERALAATRRRVA